MSGSMLRRGIVLALALAGCGREPAPAPAPAAEPLPEAADTTAAADSAAVDPPANPFAEPARRALRIELGLDDYRAIAGAWSAEDATSAFMAYFDGDTLRLIEEELDLGTYGMARAAYYFDADGLFYVVQDEASTRLAPDASGTDSLRTRAVFGPDGDIRQAERTVNGEPVSAPVVEIEGLRRHTDVLRDQLRAAVAPRPEV